MRANADTPRDARVARNFGAEGIGLCRTEHMFFEGDRITAMREMIVARDEGGRRRALAKLLPMQRADFEGIFEAMDGCPVTIRLLDPPLHEFLPHGGEETQAARAHARHAARGAQAHRRVAARDESDARPSRLPARDHLSRRSPRCRGARSSRRRCGRSGAASTCSPEIMIPLVSTLAEFEHQRAILEDVADQVLGAMGEEFRYTDRHDDRAAARRAHRG